MTKQAGIGVILDKGQQILAWHALNGGAVGFENFILSTQAESVNNVCVNDNSVYNGLTETQLLATLGGAVPVGGTGTVSPASAPSGNTLQVLCTIPINSIATSTNIHMIFITVTDPDPLSATYNDEVVFWHGCIYYDDAGTPAVYGDDGNTLPLTYQPGTSLILRVDLEYTSGFPSDVSFTNSTIVEIEQHNGDATSHNSTHIRLDGGNSPTADIDWDDNKIQNLGSATSLDDAARHGDISTVDGATYNFANYSEWLAWANSKPLAINHDIDINLAASATFASQILDLSNINGSGILTITGNPTTIKGIKLNKCKCTIILWDLVVDGLTTTIGVDLDRCSNIQMTSMDFTNCTTIIDAYRSNCSVENSTISSGNTDGFNSSYDSIISIASTTQSNPNNVSGTLYTADYRGKIYKPIDRIGETDIPRTSGTFERATTGGACIGFVGETGEYNNAVTTYDIYVENTSDATALNDWLKTFGTIVPKNLNLRIQFEDDQVLGSTRTFTLSEPIEIDGMQGAGLITIETENGDYTDMEIVNDGIVFDIKNCQCRIKFNDLTVESTSTTGTDDAIKVTNCDYFEVDATATAGKLVVKANEGNCIHLENVRTTMAKNLNLDSTDATNALFYTLDCALFNLIGPNFDMVASGKYIDINRSRGSITLGTDTGSALDAAMKFYASNGSDVNIDGTYEVGTGGTLDIDTIIFTDNSSMIKCEKNSTGNVVLTMHQKTVTLT